MADPHDVKAPKSRWQMMDVLYTGGKPSYSVAIGYWDKKPSVVMRWDGEGDWPKGSPVSSGHPTWFVVPKELWMGIVSQLGLPKPEVLRVRGFLGV